MDATQVRQTTCLMIEPTLVERFVSRLPLPYWIASLVLTIVFGPPGFLLFHYLDTGSFDYGLRAYFHGVIALEPWQQVSGLVLWSVFFYVALMMPNYIRARIQAAGSKISILIPQGGEQYHLIFRLGSYHLPAILLTGLIAAYFNRWIITALKDSAGPFEWIFYSFNLPLTYLAIGTAIWSYFGALWGLHRLGSQSLNLKNAYEDSSLGIKPVGLLALFLSYAYFGFLSLIVIIILINPLVIQLAIIVIVLTVLGTVMFSSRCLEYGGRC